MEVYFSYLLSTTVCEHCSEKSLVSKGELIPVPVKLTVQWRNRRDHTNIINRNKLFKGKEQGDMT